MSAYKHILVATDLSPQSDKLVERAVKIAAQAKAPLNLVHIVEFSPMMYGGGEFAIPLDGDIQASIHEKAKLALEKQGAQFNVPPAQQYLQAGDADESLAELVKKLEIDLLILGSHVQHGLGLLIGSTANTMLHLMPCDVLAVRV